MVSRNGTQAAAKKPITTAWRIVEELSRRCDGRLAHQPLVGGRSEDAEVYACVLCRAICRGLKKQSDMQHACMTRTCKGTRKDINNAS